MELWVPGAEVIHGPHSSGSGSMVGGAARAVWHRTVGQGYEGNRHTLVAEGFEPHLLWDPWTGQIGQFIAADRGGFALKHTDALQTNRMGSVNVQIEIADHGKTVNITDTPMANAGVVIAFLRQLGIPDALPAGPMVKLGSRHTADASTWTHKPGHYGHCHVPQNDHTDPGLMDFAKLFGAHPAGKAIPDVVHAPAFPLPRGDYYGRPSKDPHGHSGYFWAQDHSGIRAWQTKVAHRGWTLAVTGQFDVPMWKVVTAFQRKLGLPVTGRLDVATWAAAWVAPKK